VYLAFAVSASASGQIPDLFSSWVANGFSMTLPAKADLIVPFFKNVAYPLGVFGFILLTYFVIVGTSNAVNLTDGLDGLAIMPAVMVAGGLAVFAMVPGDYPAICSLRSQLLVLYFAVPVGLGLPVQRLSGRRVHGRRARLRWAPPSAPCRDRPAGDRAVDHGWRIRRETVSDDPVPHFMERLNEATTTTTSCRDGKSLRWSSAFGSSP
jgi:hypothetical protein